MMGRPLVVALLAKKGGPGKTTLALGLGSAARKRGLKSWLVDFDPQCNLTNLVIGDAYHAEVAAYERREARRPLTLFDALDEVSPTATDLFMCRQDARSNWSGLSVLPASDKLDHIDRMPAGDGAAMRFASAARDVTGPDAPDLIICDTRPAFNLLTVMALASADVALLPVEPERFSMDGLQMTWGTLGTLKTGGHLPHLRGAGVLRNKVRRELVEHQQRLEELQAIYGQFLWDGEVPNRSAVLSAIGAGVPLHDYPGKTAAECATVVDAWLTKILEYAP